MLAGPYAVQVRIEILVMDAEIEIGGLGNQTGFAFHDARVVAADRAGALQHEGVFFRRAGGFFLLGGFRLSGAFLVRFIHLVPEQGELVPEGSAAGCDCEVRLRRRGRRRRRSGGGRFILDCVDLFQFIFDGGQLFCVGGLGRFWCGGLDVELAAVLHDEKDFSAHVWILQQLK